MLPLNSGSLDRNNSGIYPKFITKILRILFQLLYNQFYWAYDLVADVVSLGLWQNWVFSVLSCLDSSPILELGPGPGHLQLEMMRKEYRTFGIDSSGNMAGKANRRLLDNNYLPGVVVGRAQQLPYDDQSFMHVVATFPSEYINDVKTLREIWRVLNTEGELTVLIGAWLTGGRWYEKLIAWIFRVTGQAPESDQHGNFEQGFYHLGEAAAIGFQVTTSIVDLDRSQVLILNAHKKIP